MRSVVPRLRLLDLLAITSSLALLASIACKVSLDHPQSFSVCWRGGRPSHVRVSESKIYTRSRRESNERKTK